MQKTLDYFYSSNVTPVRSSSSRRTAAVVTSSLDDGLNEDGGDENFRSSNVLSADDVNNGFNTSKKELISKDCGDHSFNAVNSKEKSSKGALPLSSHHPSSPQPNSPLFFPPTPPLPKQSVSALRQSHSTPSPVKRHSEQLLQVISSPSFVSDYDKIHEVNATNLGNCIVRRKNERKLLHGFECQCCSHYYDALGLDPVERQRRIDQVSRHRHANPVPKTPENYWEVKMADRDEQMRRGQIVETNSPVGLRPRNSLYAVKPLKRRLF